MQILYTVGAQCDVYLVRHFFIGAHFLAKKVEKIFKKIQNNPEIIEFGLKIPIRNPGYFFKSYYIRGQPSTK